METQVSEFLKILAWSSGPVVAVITIGKIWGWLKVKISSHDRDIAGAVLEVKELRKDNQKEHKELIGSINDTRDIVKRMEGRQNGAT